MTNSINRNKSLWSVEIFYAIPVDSESEEYGIEWEEYVESCIVSIPSTIIDINDALAFIQKTCPYGVNIVNASRITVDSN
jgi:hypothetical protein